MKKNYLMIIISIVLLTFAGCSNKNDIQRVLVVQDASEGEFMVGSGNQSPMSIRTSKSFTVLDINNNEISLSDIPVGTVVDIYFGGKIQASIPPVFIDVEKIVMIEERSEDWESSEEMKEYKQFFDIE